MINRPIGLILDGFIEIMLISFFRLALDVENWGLLLLYIE